MPHGLCEPCARRFRIFQSKMRSRMGSFAIEAVTRRSRLPIAALASSRSLKPGSPHNPAPPSRRGPGPECVNLRAIDHDVHGKHIQMNKTRPLRVSCSSLFRFLNARRSAPGPSMMSHASQSIPCWAIERASLALPETSSTTFLPSKQARRRQAGAAKRRGTPCPTRWPPPPLGAALRATPFLLPVALGRGPRSVSCSSPPPISIFVSPPPAT
mmetsp:Transcript_164644/g.523493  ORF Transcript_164644/g.523493 Transcript_164644/m.523493 type:complete len:213 (-) Transcript_164644:212-850(-)